MVVLFILGNTNQYTFANAMVAAHHHALGRAEAGLSCIYVIHSPKSEEALNAEGAWKQHIRAFGVDPSLIIPICVDFNDPQGATETLAKHLSRFLKGIDDLQEEIYIDLTNGKSIYKNTLASIGFILGVKHQFILDTDLLMAEIENPLDKARIFSTFLPPQNLLKAYVELPNPSLLDSLAALWLTEIRRLSDRARDAASVLAGIGEIPSVQMQFFERLVRSAFQDWLRADQGRHEAALSRSPTDFGNAFEELINQLYRRLAPGRSQRRKLAEKLITLSQILRSEYPAWDPKIFDTLTSDLRDLRNYGAHPQNAIGLSWRRIRARLSSEAFLCLVDYLAAVSSEGFRSQPNVTELNSHQKIKRTSGEKPDSVLYFGLDGDDVGKSLEQLFVDDAAEAEFSDFSRTVQEALREVSKAVKQEPLRGEIIFCAGDDLLFKGNYDQVALVHLQDIFRKKSGGRTCSIGFGRTPKEAYIALKMAKAQPGKNSIQGIEIVQ